jgi:uncharacterized protein YbjT (DUF2867 family)
LRIAIAAPAGNVGRKVVAELLARGEHHLRLLVRRPASVEHFAREGANVLQGSLDDEEFLIRSTREVDSLFWLTPTPMAGGDLREQQERMGRAAARAVRENGILHVVNLSGVGAEVASGPQAGLRDVEQLLEGATMNIVHLRAAYFFENYLTQLEAIRTRSSVFLPISGATRTPMIASRDIAWVAANRLLDRGWTGRQICELHGPADLRFDEAAALLSRALGRSIAHVRIPPGTAWREWRNAGYSTDVADALVEMYDAMEQGKLRPAMERTAATTTPTKLVEFGRTLLRPLLGDRVAS